MQAFIAVQIFLFYTKTKISRTHAPHAEVYCRTDGTDFFSGVYELETRFARFILCVFFPSSFYYLCPSVFSPSRNSGPGSHSRLFSSLPTQFVPCIFIATRFHLFLPSSTRVEFCVPTLASMHARYPGRIVSPKRQILPALQFASKGHDVFQARGVLLLFLILLRSVVTACTCYALY